jgi:TadE-like protein
VPSTTLVCTRRRGRRGNAFVEAAFVLVPLFALIFAIVDFGIAIFVRSTLQHAVREGVRYAITYQTIDDQTGHDDSIKSVVQKSAMGFLSGEGSAEKIKVRYYDPANLGEVPENNPGNVVEISVEGFQWGWLALLMRNASPLQITTRAADRMEGLPAGTLPPQRTLGG